MKHIYNAALALLDLRIKQCGTALQCETDAYGIAYWNKELALAHFKKAKIAKRLKIEHNVIKIDFKTRKRVA